MAGEAETQPNVRVPSLRDGRLPKLMSAALSQRIQGGSLPASDIIIMMDGGREGRIHILNNPSVPERMNLKP